MKRIRGEELGGAMRAQREKIFSWRWKGVGELARNGTVFAWKESGGS